MTIIYLGIAWMVGIALASVTNLPWELWSLAALITLIAAVLFHNKGVARIWLLMAGFLLLGALRFTFAIPDIDDGHIAFFNGQDPVTLTGMTIKDPVIRDRSQDLRIKPESIELPDNTTKLVDGLILLTVPPIPEIAYGSRIKATGHLEEPSSIGDFDYKQYLARQDIHSQMSWPDVKILSDGHGSIFYRAIYAIKSRAQTTIDNLLPDPQAALLSGILLGNDKGISPDLADDFRRTGLTHIIAISGFNIAILTGLLLAVSRPILGHKRSAWFVIIGVVTYTIFVGADAAVVRAAIMAVIFVVAARLMGRPTFAPAGLFTAALVMTLINPHILWNVGFQLSFAATLGLMLYVGPMSDWTSARLRPKIGSDKTRKITRMFSEILFATMAAMLLTLPIILYHFEQLSIVSPLANLFVLPAQPGVMVWGGLATLTGMVIPALGQLIAWVAWVFLAYTIGLVRFFASVPNAAVPMSLGPAGVVASYAFILGTSWIVFQKSEKRNGFASRIRQSFSWTVTLFGLAIVAVLVNFWAFSQPDGDLHVAFLDVGQGDATFIQTPSGRQILVDGGAYPSVLKDHLGQQIPFWDKDIDLVIATHPDADHVAALPDVFERYEVGRLITNGQTSGTSSFETLLVIAQENGTPLHVAQAGEVIVIDDAVRIEILNPTADRRQQTAEKSDNEASVAMRLEYGNFSLLLTGDAGAETERVMMAVGRPLSAVVYKAGHHGARSSSSKLFLDTVKPQYVVISAGEDNRYGHPHEETLERMSDVGAVVLRTDELGTIEVISDGKVMWWEVDR